MEDKDNWQMKFDSCEYSDRLLDKLLELNMERPRSEKINIVEVQKAIYYAKKYHGSQKRQSGEPYYSHPFEVAYMVSDYLFRTDVLVTSILHDTIEDTSLTFEMIDSIFGARVARQVEDLTRVKAGDIKITSKDVVESLWLQKKYDLLLIKQFDRLHNMQTIGVKSPEKIKQITEETIGIFTVLAASLGTRDIEDKLIQICAGYCT
jgi:(p)ppGpp synthase/HD superfamily hydrolase